MKTIAQRELRNHSGEILRQAESGEQFTVTVDGRPVAVLGPYQKRQWILRADHLAGLAAAPVLSQSLEGPPADIGEGSSRCLGFPGTAGRVTGLGL